jgi:hypothetical protein
VTAGYLLADQWERVLEFTEPFQTLVIILIALVLVVLVVRKVVTTKRTRDLEEAMRPGVTHERFNEIVRDLKAEQVDGPDASPKSSDDL